jgi:hypothetical protein
MGSMTRVRCRECGYDSGELVGVGGDIGMMGRPVWTVSCEKKHRLIDVWAPDDAESRKGYWYKIDLPAPDFPCPKCGKVHEVWDPEKAVCPKCGAKGCEVTLTGLWD